ncbi:hypothetical protein RhiirA5_495099 [Rhizophagus irregularis]|uniref:Uncharacterized protein n=1 Tax=Rhizophagus irregularis TaxID=588596 RepID=A0A2I1DV26_9GLOM|nr:hypothetical protein RhiirA5_495099 [Rhizophagus irregularis]PKC74182.1 hypothetical protein RhiirA1_529812 [Rhizophagus irregularis]PKY13725.1 hypothetical protein RhiirB3_425601 [Rhizophagus irregularis]GET61646.1 kinase-like domain-containing protein [Rhizophagus irregularis DAOM 181602=DAOM 197198]
MDNNFINEEETIYEEDLILELEYRERELALKECEILLREREAKVRVMELSNLEKERELKLH